MSAPPFERTTCACDECRACCARPASLAPGDLEAIAVHRGQTIAATRAEMQVKSVATVGDSHTGEIRAIPGMTPRVVNGRCIYQRDDDTCSVHPVAPFGCRMFDMHMSGAEGDRRSVWSASLMMSDAVYRAHVQAIDPEAADRIANRPRFNAGLMAALQLLCALSEPDGD